MTKRKRKRTRFYPYGGVGDLPAGVFDSNHKRTHDRPLYTREEADEVADWLNGQDRPLPTMIDRAHDDWDPGRPQALRGSPEPYPWIAGRTRTDD